MELKEISEMSDEELKEYLAQIRLSRKVRSPTKKASNPFEGLDPELAQKILNEITERKRDGQDRE